MKIRILKSRNKYCEWCGKETECKFVVYTYDVHTGEKIENVERICSNKDCSIERYK